MRKEHSSLIDSLSAMPFELNFVSNREVVIEGSKGVLLYSENIIKINTTSALLCFYGRGLNLKCISSTNLIISGFVEKVEFVC